MHNRAVTMLTAASASGSASESLARSGAGSYAAERLTPSELSAIVQAAPLETLPASTLFLLVQAAAAANHKADDGLVDRIRKIQRLHASDFWINFAAARFFESQQPPHDEDAVRYYSVAVAVRPAAAAAHSNLGAALSRLGETRRRLPRFAWRSRRSPVFMCHTSTWACCCANSRSTPRPWTLCARRPTQAAASQWCMSGWGLPCKLTASSMTPSRSIAKR
jgi:hypothetical protein